MEYTVSFYMKGQSLDAKTFETYEEARTFICSLSVLKDCECYKLHRG